MSDKEKQKQMQDFLNRKRKMDLKKAEYQNPSTSSEKKSKEEDVETEEDDEMEKRKEKERYEKAKKALLFDAKRAKDRADTVGPQGYLKPKSLSTNKQFLRRTIVSTLPRGKQKDAKGQEQPNKN